MDALIRSWRLLLIAAGFACGPSKLGPVGVSGPRSGEREVKEDAAAEAPMLLPSDFRVTWNKVGARVASEHERFASDAYEQAQTRFAEDLFVGDAGAGIYLIERGDGGIRFAVADARGRTLADTAGDGGASLEACARCHANAHNAIFPVQ